ncbi:restriction endonuclease subunit S [Vibrio parahaemolyticus]|uniref:restriction endonuclease subunit S n=1 Tax=Vibrio parahaemolyticus TaxID=670 RepID=UPI00111EE561|nr:restriction endonuclease subunit S [Vibrio parahaemolyticus]TOH87542.1 restriction endonuclease [Vibrio parahaemolyticus]TOL02736.1 restriction endonuclease [Vibrio parahaemolyticus]TOP86902.1 restriction endonuclease [Vibrio parahaemolyticus]TOQ27872.1 restriction endonuclease [Vibrio parahaemolyticus]HAV1368368.1 restriction endonuclease subunit S [Vibrio parahaemolyticus]
MSVDKLRGSYHVNRVSPNEIGLLLSAQSYRPAVTKAINKIKEGEWRTLQSLISNVISPGPHPKYDGDYPCLKTKNVQDLIAETSPADWADISEISDLSKVQVGKGDLLINLTGAGSIGRVSVYYGDDLPITNQHIAKMSPNNLIDEGYLVAYLRSFYAERALEQGVAGSTGQINMVNDHVRCTPVRICHSSAQKYIGEKVRQAERLRAWAKQLRAYVNSVLDDLALPIHAKPHMYSYANKSILGDRLDPRPYRSNVVDLVNGIESLLHDKMSSLVTLSSGCPVSSDDFVEENFEIPLIRIRNISEEGFKGLDTGVTRKTYADAENYQAKEGMIVLGMDGYFKAQFFIREELPILINQRVAMLTVSGIRTELLTHWLNRPEGQLQLNQWAVKTTVEHTSLTDLAKVLIPRLNDNLETELADKLLDARYSIKLSYKLTNLAKHLVEDLIEGQLTESQLVSAQQALEAGDDSLDRALLERMTAEGVDGEGEPLFDDIDQLYELLDKAKHALEAEDTMAEA